MKAQETGLLLFSMRIPKCDIKLNIFYDILNVSDVMLWRIIPPITAPKTKTILYARNAVMKVIS